MGLSRLVGRKCLANRPGLGHKRRLPRLRSKDYAPFMRSRLLAFLAAPLFTGGLLLGGCQTLTGLGNNAAATVGLEDDVPKAYTASEESKPQRSGIAVADEPLAARAGATVLAAGGSAVDAVTTMFFTLSATYPVAAGLGS